MKQKLTLIIILFAPFFVKGQALYSKAYGKANNPAIIFIHGGPSGNSTLFEATTAQNLADKGFYVIIYDRRGEGRSADSTANFTYKEAFNDLIKIYQTYHIETTNIIGHSFGGLVATLFTDKYPEKVKSLVLAGALFSQQDTYNHILKSAKQICLTKYDSVMMNKVNEVEKLNKNSVEYRNECYEISGNCGFFEMPKPTRKSDELRHEYMLSAFYKTNIRNNQAPILFYKNEPFNNIDTKPVLRSLKNKGVKLYAIYGKQDRIFSTLQLNEMLKIVGKNNFLLIDNCSHYLFVDQQEAFLENVVKWLK